MISDRIAKNIFFFKIKHKNPKFFNQSLMASSSSSNQATSMQVDYGESYKNKGRTMEITEDELVVQVENPVDFISLKHHDCDVSNYLFLSRAGWLFWNVERFNL